MFDVELRVFKNGGNDRVRVERHQKRRAVRRTLGDLRSAERTGGAGLVLHQDGTAEFRLQIGLNEPGQGVRGTSWRKWHHQRDDLGRLSQRRRNRESG